MIDEDAFGLLISYLNIEDDEYGGEREDFVMRHSTFRDLVGHRLLSQPPGNGAHAIDLGHSIYIELLEGNQDGDLIGWLRAVRTELSDSEFVTAGILTYGSSWCDGSDPCPALMDIGAIKMIRASNPSEPLRRALCADAACRGDEEAGDPGWGSGLYLDVEAVETLGRKPKNQPTILRSKGCQYYRAGA